MSPQPTRATSQSRECPNFYRSGRATDFSLRGRRVEGGGRGAALQIVESEFGTPRSSFANAIRSEGGRRGGARLSRPEGRDRFRPKIASSQFVTNVIVLPGQLINKWRKATCCAHGQQARAGSDAGRLRDWRKRSRESGDIGAPLVDELGLKGLTLVTNCKITEAGILFLQAEMVEHSPRPPSAGLRSRMNRSETEFSDDLGRREPATHLASGPARRRSPP